MAPGTPPFQANVTLDGDLYSLTAWWNVYGQRWYVTIRALDGTLVLAKPMVGSPQPAPLESLVWVEGALEIDGATTDVPLPAQSASGLAVATAAAPLNFAVGQVMSLTIVSNTPDAFAGTFRCTVLDRFRFVYPLVTNPQYVPTNQPVAHVAGAQDSWYSADADLVEGYFSSSLVYRPFAGRLEVSP